MFGIGVMELLIIVILGLGCIGAVVAVTVAATAGARRGENAPHQPVVTCPACGAVRPAADRFCGACGKPLSK